METKEMLGITNWKRECRATARRIWGHGYSKALEEIMQAHITHTAIFIQHEPWNDDWALQELADLERGEVMDIVGLLDRALTYGYLWDC